MSDGNFDYPLNKEHMDKVNAQRRALSLMKAKGIKSARVQPLVSKGDLLFVTAESRNNQPNGCWNCQFYLKNQSRCALIGDNVAVKEFAVQNIKYWPVCGKHEFGKPMDVQGSKIEYLAHNDPDLIGLVWINQAVGDMKTPGGANCGGINGGDDCDHYLVSTEKKWESATGLCRKLNCTVAAGDCCSGWGDDDQLDWQKAQFILRQQGEDAVSESSVPGGKLKDSVDAGVVEPDNNKE